MEFLDYSVFIMISAVHDKYFPHLLVIDLTDKELEEEAVFWYTFKTSLFTIFITDNERILVIDPLRSSNTLLVDLSGGITIGFSSSLKNFSIELCLQTRGFIINI